jgi:leucyl/phenylalanyl-tRNA---protein transferase
MRMAWLGAALVACGDKGTTDPTGSTVLVVPESVVPESVVSVSVVPVGSVVPLSPQATKAAPSHAIRISPPSGFGIPHPPRHRNGSEPRASFPRSAGALGLHVPSRPRAPLAFPPPSLADPSGLLAAGGDLEPDRLLLAYRSGIFPWYSRGPILWWSPDPRYVLFSAELTVGRSLAKRIRQQRYRITLDRSFEAVVDACARVPRPGQRGTWITPEMRRAYLHLHELGHAHSVEAWEDDRLVGGLYGVAVGRLYAGESMFAHAPDASKVAFVHLVRQLTIWGFPLVDCQVHTEHLERFGARAIPRDEYLQRCRSLADEPGRDGPWAFDSGFVCHG